MTDTPFSSDELDRYAAYFAAGGRRCALPDLVRLATLFVGGLLGCAVGTAIAMLLGGEL